MPASSAAVFPPKIPTVAKPMPVSVAVQLAAKGVPGISVPTVVAPNIPTAGPTGVAAGLGGDGGHVILVCVCSHTESAVTFTYIAQTSRHRGA